MDEKKILNAMEKALLHIDWYYSHNYSDVIKLKEVQYGLGVIYGYGEILREINYDSLLKFHEEHINDIKEYYGFCRKITKKYMEV